MSVIRITFLAAAGLGLLAGCGGGSGGTATEAASFEEALGLDQASIQAREAKVQEKVRACMKAEGFDYIPLDPSNSNMQFRLMGPGAGNDDPEFRKKNGYGIATMAGGRRSSVGAASDPNQAIREGLSDADREAYELALFGEANVSGAGDRGIRITRRAAGGGGGEGVSAPEERGCFGKAQAAVPGGPAELGDDLRDLFERIEADPRLIAANQEWAACMADAGYPDFDTPRAIVQHLVQQMNQLSGAPEPDEDGRTAFVIGGADIDPEALAELKAEELELASLDDDCAKKTGRSKVEREVREEAQARFLEEHPDLVAGS
jgi:hypothetical protein